MILAYAYFFHIMSCANKETQHIKQARLLSYTCAITTPAHKYHQISARHDHNHNFAGSALAIN